MAAGTEFPLTCQQTREKIREYQQLVESGEFEKADFWHFCGFLGVDDETVLQIIRSPGRKNRELALELRKLVSWVKGQYATAPGWNGSNGSKALFLLKQDLGGVQLTDKPEGRQEGKLEVRVKFGGRVKDPFG